MKPTAATPTTDAAAARPAAGCAAPGIVPSSGGVDGLPHGRANASPIGSPSAPGGTQVQSSDRAASPLAAVLLPTRASGFAAAAVEAVHGVMAIAGVGDGGDGD